MAITKLQFFEECSRRFSDASVGIRLEQMFNLLSVGQQTTILEEMKTDLVTIYQSDLDQATTTKNIAVSNLDATINSINQKITDAQGVT
jgi:hypothetical protein